MQTCSLVSHLRDLSTASLFENGHLSHTTHKGKKKRNKKRSDSESDSDDDDDDDEEDYDDRDDANTDDEFMNPRYPYRDPAHLRMSRSAVLRMAAGRAPNPSVPAVDLRKNNIAPSSAAALASSVFASASASSATTLDSPAAASDTSSHSLDQTPQRARNGKQSQNTDPRSRRQLKQGTPNDADKVNNIFMETESERDLRAKLQRRLSHDDLPVVAASPPIAPHHAESHAVGAQRNRVHASRGSSSSRVSISLLRALEMPLAIVLFVFLI